MGGLCGLYYILQFYSMKLLHACTCSFNGQETINIYCMVRVKGVIEGM